MATIYVIDDDRDFAEAVGKVLEGAGHQVTLAHEAAKGLALVSQTPPDLLILDIMMQNPDDGMVIARKLRQAGGNFPIIMLSAIGKVTGLQFGIDGEALPADAFLEKPVLPTVLRDAVSRFLKPQ